MTGVQTLVPLMLDHVQCGACRCAVRRPHELQARSDCWDRLQGRIASVMTLDRTIGRSSSGGRTITNAMECLKPDWTPHMMAFTVTGWPVRKTFGEGREHVEKANRENRAERAVGFWRKTMSVVIAQESRWMGIASGWAENKIASMGAFVETF